MKKSLRKKISLWMVSLFMLSILATFTVGLQLAGAADTNLEMPAGASTAAKGPQLISRDQYDAVYTAPDVMIDKETYEAEYERAYARLCKW